MNRCFGEWRVTNHGIYVDQLSVSWHKKSTTRVRVSDPLPLLITVNSNNSDNKQGTNTEVYNEHITRMCASVECYCAIALQFELKRDDCGDSFSARFGLTVI